MKRIITICGSMRFQEEMMRTAARLEAEGHLVLQCVYPQKGEVSEKKP